jgi:hypothetical protein
MNRSAVWLLALLLAGATIPAEIPASTGQPDLSSVIESFVVDQFPLAQKHFWVVNGTQWQAENEVVVDVNTVTLNPATQAPTESRFLLLIVAGRLAAAQHIPLDSQPECQPEQQA